MKQVHICVLLLFCLASPAAVADPSKDKGHSGQDKKQNRQDDANGVKIIIRPDSDKKQRQDKDNSERGNSHDNNRNNDNSNRQSDTDSLKGLERAQERRSAQAEAHAQAGSQDDSGWYEYLFGKKQEAGEKSERDWYGYLFGKPAVKKDEADQDKDAQEDANDRRDNRWWPFD